MQAQLLSAPEPRNTAAARDSETQPAAGSDFAAETEQKAEAQQPEAAESRPAERSGTAAPAGETCLNEVAAAFFCNAATDKQQIFQSNFVLR